MILQGSSLSDVLLLISDFINLELLSVFLCSFVKRFINLIDFLKASTLGFIDF